MGRKKKSRYTVRADGRHVRTEVIDGKRKFFYGKDDDECDEKYDQYMKGQKKAKAEALLFKTVTDEWWSLHESTLSPNSVAGYRVAMRRAVAEFGNRDITTITGRDVMLYLKEYADKGYSQKVINNSKSVLKQIMDYAMSANIISFNPCVGIKQIKGAPKVPRKAAPADDVAKIEKYKTENLAGRMMYFMLWTGARRGEAACVQQKDVDLKSRTVRIDKAIAYGDTRKPILGPPKSDAGKRLLDLYDNVLEVLPQYDDPETYIFFPEGLPTKTHLEKVLRNFRVEHGITATAHQLRHSFATKLHSYGVDVKDAQGLLGHSTIAVTQDVYTEIEDVQKSKVHNKVNRAVQKEIKQITKQKT